MTDLSRRRTQLTFTVSTMVREQGKLRPIVLTPHPGCLEVRLKGLRRTLSMEIMPMKSRTPIARRLAVTKQRKQERKLKEEERNDYRG